MYRIYTYLISYLLLTVSVVAVPFGLSGLTVGMGAGGLTSGYIQGEYDFTMSKYVCLGPEFNFGFGGGGAIYAGCAGRFYVIPDTHPVFQPQLTFGAGVAHRFDDGDTRVDDTLTGMYIIAGPGCDFDIPNSPISPYLDFGGFFFIGDDSDADFKIEVGVRFKV